MEIVEVRIGIIVIMFLKNFRVKIILFRRKEDLFVLFSNIIGEEVVERLECKNGLNYVELEIYGSNMRI